LYPFLPEESIFSVFKKLKELERENPKRFRGKRLREASGILLSVLFLRDQTYCKGLSQEGQTLISFLAVRKDTSSL